MKNTPKLKIGQKVKTLSTATRKEGLTYEVIDIIYEGGFYKYELSDFGGVQREMDIGEV